MDLQGKVAFVTGGSGNIGGAIARALATAGADVALSYVGQLDVATAMVDVLCAAGRRSLAVQLDQRNPVAIDGAVDRVVRELGRVDILVNNAAWNIGIPFTDLDALTPEILGLCPGNESAGAVFAREGLRPALTRASGRPDREYRLGGRLVPGE